MIIGSLGPLSNNTVTHCSRIARMSDTPPKRTRGKRGGDPFRRSQVNRKAAGLVSHLDYHDPDSFEADRIAQERREERSRSVAKTGAVAKGPVEPRYPPRAVPAASVAGGESRRGVPQRQIIVTQFSVVVPARPIPPPPAPSGAAEGQWQLSWVWVPNSEDPGAASSVDRSAAPTAPPKAPSRRRSRSPLRRKSPKGVPAKPSKAGTSVAEAKTPVAKADTRVAEAPKESARKQLPRPRVKPTAETTEATSSRPRSPKVTGAKAVSGTAEEVIEVEEEPARSSSPLPTRKKKARGAAPSSGSRTSVGAGGAERPLIGLDWHRTLSHEKYTDSGVKESFVPPASVVLIRELQRKGFDFCVVSFSSNVGTQRQTLDGATNLQAQLERNFTQISIVPRKKTSDYARKASITGNWESKAELVRDLGCAIYIDDQEELCQDIRSLQSSRAVGNRVQTVVANSRSPTDSLKPLANLVKDKEVSEFPVPSVLKSFN